MAVAILDQIAPSRKPAGLSAKVLRVRQLCDALLCFIRRQGAGRTPDPKLQVLDQLLADETRGIAERPLLLWPSVARLPVGRSLTGLSLFWFQGSGPTAWWRIAGQRPVPEGESGACGGEPG